MSRFALIAFILLAVSTLCWTVYRDIHIERLFTGDLRNRVVGARLQLDGQSPYFYHWSSGDNMRYYDAQNYGHLKVSNVTATPFFHQLLSPIANFQQRKISRIWLVIEYAALIVMSLLAIGMTTRRNQRYAVVVISLLFLYSYAWTANIEMGQLYIIIPLLAMLFYFCISRPPNLMLAVLAGIFAASLILVRPNAVLFLLPFVFVAGRYSPRYKISFLLAALLIFGAAFITKNSRLYWSDYKTAVNEHIRFHQSLSPTLQKNEAIPVVGTWEGWDITQIKKDKAEFPYRHNGENGNVFVLSKSILHYNPPLWLLSAAGIACMAFLCIIFFMKYRSAGFAMLPLALLGYSLYMISDLFSPVHRFQYNAVQWIFPLLLLASAYSSNYKKLFIAGVIGGLLLNSISYSFLPMQRTVGEYLLFISILGLLFASKNVIEPRAA